MVKGLVAVVPLFCALAAHESRWGAFLENLIITFIYCIIIQIPWDNFG